MTIRHLLVFSLVSTLLPAPVGAQAAGPRKAAGQARLDASVRAAPVGLPAKKSGARELTYAFGKRSTEGELARLAEEALIDRAYFDRRAGDGEADFLVELTLDKARSSHQDFGGWESQASTYEVSARVSYRWLDASGAAVAEGELEGFARISVEGSPRRPDAARAWARLIDDAVSRAFADAFEKAAFGNEPPPPGGWIEAGSGD